MLVKAYYLSSPEALVNRISEKIIMVADEEEQLAEILIGLYKGECIIVGSTSNGGILISSETHFLPYMNLRPFRVNAGALHSYVCGQDNMSPYLSDLLAGSKLLCVDTDGNAREIVVGRVKMETRPLLMICADAVSIRINLGEAAYSKIKGKET